jgi:hypothetical protein
VLVFVKLVDEKRMKQVFEEDGWEKHDGGERRMYIMPLPQCLNPALASLNPTLLYSNLSSLRRANPSECDHPNSR